MALLEFPSLASLGRRVARRLRRGRPIVVVSGLPRSGTSMAMRMLEAGGMPVLTDGRRGADDSNPHGYYELDRVLALDKPGPEGDASWLAEARGRAVKVVSALLPHLPETFSYDVIFMHRDLREVVASQNRMLASSGETVGAPDDDRLRQVYETHLGRIANLLARRRCFRVLDLHYREVVDQPIEQARRIREFLDLPLDIERMAAAVDPGLYRNRSSGE